MSKEQESDKDLDEADRKENELAAEVSSLFQRVIDGMRTYPPGHVTVRGYTQSLFDRLNTLTKNDEQQYGLKVTPLGFATDTRIVNPVTKLTDSITHPLYLDGVHRLSMEDGLIFDELMRFMDVWKSAIDNTLGDTHTFSTRVWEEDFDTIVITTVDSFSEGGISPEAKRAAERYKGVVSQLTGEAPMDAGGGALEASGAAAGAAGGGKAKPRRMARLTKEDLRALKVRGVPDLSEHELQRMTQSEPSATMGLQPDQLESLSKELHGQHAHQVERAFDAFFNVGLLGTAPEQDRLRTAVELLLQALLARKHVGKVRDSLMKMMESARSGDPTGMEARFSFLARLMKAIEIVGVLDPLVVALDDENHREAATVVLRFLPQQMANALLDRLEKPQTPAGTTALLELIAHLKPDPVELAGRLIKAPEPLQLELLKLGVALGAAGWPVRKAALGLKSKAVQLAAIKGLDKAEMLTHKTELLPLLMSPVAEIRHELFGPFVSSHDKAVAPALCTMLRRVQLDATERKRVLVALGTLGGPEAIGTLRTEFSSLTDVELKCTVAHALGAAGDEKSRPLLEKEAGRWFGGGPLKDAAKSALKRLDELKKTGGKA